jgi:hypothetical protein
MLLYQHFLDATSAQNYCNTQTAAMRLPHGQETVVWAAPILLADGSYAVQSYDGVNAVAWQSSWHLPPNPQLR